MKARASFRSPGNELTYTSVAVHKTQDIKQNSGYGIDDHSIIMLAGIVKNAVYHAVYGKEEAEMAG